MNSRENLSAGARRHYDALDAQRARTLEAEQRAKAAEARAERAEACLRDAEGRLDAVERTVARLERRKPSSVVHVQASVSADGGMLLYGVQAIADFLGVRKRQALGLIERGHLPHYHVGRVVCANRATVTAWLKAREATEQTPLQGGRADG